MAYKVTFGSGRIYGSGVYYGAEYKGLEAVGIPSEETFGSATIFVTVQRLLATGIESEEVFGRARIKAFAKPWNLLEINVASIIALENLVGLADANLFAQKLKTLDYSTGYGIIDFSTENLEAVINE
jgi:hypothetical protein